VSNTLELGPKDTVPVGLSRSATEGVKASPHDALAGHEAGLEFINVTKTYGNVHAVKNISLAIETGRFAVLLGPSGCGKTSLLGLVGGFIQPDSGDVLIKGRSTRGIPANARDVGVVFQDYALFPHMTVAENVAFPLEVRGFPRQLIASRVADTLAMVDLSDLGARNPAQLSGGQQQRVALARALVYEPPILLLDEPLGALDRRLRDTMQMELKALHHRLGITFVFVTHDQDEALAMADMVIVMRDGEIQQVGSPLDIYDRPRTRFVATFVGDCNVLPARATGTELRDDRSGVVLHLPQGRYESKAGTRSWVAIRPEWIRIASPGERLENYEGSTEGRVSRCRFLGSEVILQFETAMGPLLVRTGRSAGGPLPESDAASLLVWDARSTVMLADELG
jgi:ABC-type Fe3+/spermidine/putrescine transport system ATPase subunit